jgi:beta-galactosidase
MWSTWPTTDSWTWQGWEGKPIEVVVYSREPQVKLYLNDQLIGEQSTKEMKAVFTVNYQPGTLRAEAGSDRCELQTAGAPARIRLTADRQQMKADGQSLLFVTIEVVDKEGRVVPEAQLPLDVKVNGSGTLLAVGNANPRDNDPYYDAKHTTWNGRALAVVRSNGKRGTVVVTVNGKRLTVKCE